LDCRPYQCRVAREFANKTKNYNFPKKQKIILPEMLNIVTPVALCKLCSDVGLELNWPIGLLHYLCLLTDNPAEESSQTPKQTESDAYSLLDKMKNTEI